MVIEEIQTSSVLTKSKLPGCYYCINPYVGCSYGCVYCYANLLVKRKGHREKWGTYVGARAGAPTILATELKRYKCKGKVLLSSVTDAYQPIEKKYALTRNILALLIKYNFPISILTKSTLVLRDIDIISQSSQCEVGLTVSFHDDNICKQFEPRAVSLERRLRTLRILRDSGIRTYAFIGPIFPFLTDFRKILKDVAGCVEFVMAEALNLRCGNWKELAPLLEDIYPHSPTDYRNIVSSRDYWDEVEADLQQTCNRLDIPLAGFYRHEI